MTTVLIVLTLIEVALLVVVLAAYLILIAGSLRSTARTLGLITFGVRAIEKQTEPVGPALREINAALEQVASRLGPSKLPASRQHQAGALPQVPKGETGPS
jgi:hypothetical protein